MISTLARSLGTIALIGLATAPPAWAQWTTNTSQNTLVSTAPTTSRPAMIRGANGGTYVLWEDAATGVYLQFVDAAGHRQPTDRLVDAQGREAVMATDGAGGVFVAWNRLPGRIMVQRFDDVLDPHPQWFSIAIPVANTGGDQSQPSIVADGANGIVVSWTDDSQDPHGDIRAQRLNGNGGSLWGSSGRILCNVAGRQVWSQLATDGAGGAFAVWEDDRSDSGDIYAQYVVANGDPQWPAVNVPTGAAVFTGNGWQTRPRVVSDDNGGFITAWYDGQPAPAKLRAQRVYGSGLTAWNTAVDLGPLAGFESDNVSFALDRDGQGGAILAWAKGFDIQAQRLTPGGTKVWGNSGAPVTSGGHSNLQRIAPAVSTYGDGGAVIAWSTLAKSQPIDGNVYSLEVRAQGQVVGVAGGDVVSDAPGDQVAPAVVADGRCRSKFAWTDHRPGSADGVYTHRRGRRLFTCLVMETPQVAFGEYVTMEEMRRVPIVQGPNGVTQGFQTGEFEVAYDAELFELIDVRLEGGALATAAVEIHSETPGRVRVVSWGGVAVEPGAPIFELVLAPRADTGAAVLSLTTARLDGEPVVVEGTRVEIEP